jgi:hypothetical protein
MLGQHHLCSLTIRGPFLCIFAKGWLADNARVLPHLSYSHGYTLISPCPPSHSVCVQDPAHANPPSLLLVLAKMARHATAVLGADATEGQVSE